MTRVRARGPGVFLFLYFSEVDMSGILRVTLVGMVFLPGFASGNAVLDLDGVRREVAGRNPEIRAAMSRARGFDAEVSAEKALPPPELTYERHGIGGGGGMEENLYGISQRIPFPLKIVRRAETARAKAGAEESKAREVRLEVVARAERVYFDLFFFEHAIPIVEQTAEIFRGYLRAGAARYATGAITQNDLLRAQTELSRLYDRLVTLGQERTSARVSLNALMDHPVDEIPGIPRAPEFVALPEPGLLESEALRSRPALDAAEGDLERMRAGRSEARLEYLPDLSLKYSYRTRPLAENDSMIMAGVDLPFLWFNRPRAINRAATARVREREADLDSLRLETRAAVRRDWTEADTARRRAELLHTTLLPQANQARNTAEKAHATRQIRFFEYLDTLRTDLEVRLDYYDALRTYGQRVSDLERLVGKELREVNRAN